MHFVIFCFISVKIELFVHIRKTERRNEFGILLKEWSKTIVDRKMYRGIDV